MNAELKVALKEAFPDAILTGPYIYFGPKDHLVSGFCLEMTRNGIYISEFVYPLFKRSDQLSLLFSERLPYPEGFVDYERWEGNKRVDEVVNWLDANSQRVKEKLSLGRFVSEIQSHPVALKNKWVQMVNALALILLGEYCKARVIIQYLSDQELPKGMMQISEECRVLNGVLECNPDKARILVEGWEQEMKAKLKL
ncbi:hypothetical protein [Microbulbifer variabilis]|uniref:hypothetical protein n=1 Tax=Microbulbifer variabilis TaxID=266805 RepID=UPI00037FA3F5|nr:hypothetical protein [Microbulbifer variabilis]